MTLGVYTPATYTGNASATVFSIPWRYLDTNHIKVYLDDVLQSIGFTVSSAPADTGTVTFANAPGTGVGVRITREVPLDQPVDFENQTTFRAARHEDAYDRAVMQIAQVDQVVDRAVTVDVGSTPQVLPDPAPGYVIGWSAGNQLANLTGLAIGTVVSSAMQPVVTAATLAAARSAMGPWSDAVHTATGGTTARTLASAKADTISVLDFGAVGDGATNDAAAFQAAINAAGAAGGGTVLVPGGKVYRLATKVTFAYDGVSLVGGAGFGSLILVDSDVGRLFEIKNAAVNIQNIGLENLTIYASVNQTSGELIYAEKMANSRWASLNIVNGFVGVTLAGCVACHFTDMHIHCDGTTTGNTSLLRLKAASGPVLPSELFFTNCNIRGSSTTPASAEPTSGVVITAADGVWFTGCHIGLTKTSSMYARSEDNSDQLNGIHASNTWFDHSQFGVNIDENATAFSYRGGHVFSGCQFSGQSTSAVRLAEPDAVGVSFAGCLFGRSTSHPIDVVACSGLNISGGQVFDGGPATHGIIVRTAARSVGISDVGFFNTSGYTMANGVLIEGTPSRVAVTGCVFNGVNGVVATGTPTNWSVTGCATSESSSIASATNVFLPEAIDVFSITGTTTIDSITNVRPGRRVTLVFADVLTVTDGTLKLNGNFTTAAGATLSLCCIGGLWYETSRVTT